MSLTGWRRSVTSSTTVHAKNDRSVSEIVKELINASCHRKALTGKIRTTEGSACPADRERRREVGKHRGQICFGAHQRGQRRGVDREVLQPKHRSPLGKAL